MAYTIYRNVRVTSIRQKEVVPNRRTQDIVDPVRRRDPYTVTVAELSEVPTDVSFSDFKKELKVGHYVSIAVTDKWDVLAVVNHTTGESAALRYKSTPFSEWWGILFFVSIPAVLCFFIARKAFSTEKYHDMGYVVAAVGVGIVLAVLFGVNKQFVQSKKALAELQAQ